jgi:hypothetical protein
MMGFRAGWAAATGRIFARTRIEACPASEDMPSTHFDSVAYSALTISSVIFLASPNNIMVLSR